MLCFLCFINSIQTVRLLQLAAAESGFLILRHVPLQTSGRQVDARTQTNVCPSAYASGKFGYTLIDLIASTLRTSGAVSVISFSWLHVPFQVIPLGSNLHASLTPNYSYVASYLLFSVTDLGNAWMQVPCVSSFGLLVASSVPALLWSHPLCFLDGSMDRNSGAWGTQKLWDQVWDAATTNRNTKCVIWGLMRCFGPYTSGERSS